MTQKEKFVRVFLAVVLMSVLLLVVDGLRNMRPWDAPKLKHPVLGEYNYSISPFPHTSPNSNLVFQQIPTPVAGAKPNERFFGFDIHDKKLNTRWSVLISYNVEGDEKISPSSATASIIACDQL